VGGEAAPLRQGFWVKNELIGMFGMSTEANIGLLFVCRQRAVSMDVRWRERDWESLREEVAEARPAVRATLAASGLLKFFECPLLRA
jgi:hypothetical protein